MIKYAGGVKVSPFEYDKVYFIKNITLYCHTSLLYINIIHDRLFKLSSTFAFSLTYENDECQVICRGTQAQHS